MTVNPVVLEFNTRHPFYSFLCMQEKMCRECMKHLSPAHSEFEFFEDMLALCMAEIEAYRETMGMVDGGAA